MNRSEKTLFAFVMGAAAGLTAGFLFAPAKGENTRKKLSSKATELKDEFKENLDTDKLRELANSAISGVEKYSQKFSEVIKN
jgi:gas vesicle protein